MPDDAADFAYQHETKREYLVVGDVNFYQLLSVARTAKPEEIRQAYVRLVKHIHPDLAGSARWPTARLEDLQRAYRCLLDPEARRMHDAQLEESDLAHAERLRRVERRLRRRSRPSRGLWRVRATAHRARRINWRVILLILAGVVVIAKLRGEIGSL